MDMRLGESARFPMPFNIQPVVGLFEQMPVQIRFDRIGHSGRVSIVMILHPKVLQEPGLCYDVLAVLKIRHSRVLLILASRSRLVMTANTNTTRNELYLFWTAREQYVVSQPVLEAMIGVEAYPPVWGTYPEIASRRKVRRLQLIDAQLGKAQRIDAAQPQGQDHANPISPHGERR